MRVVLYHPQIPQNTGNIVRTCKATHTDLVLVKPLGFSTSDKHLKRAGLDYWDGVHVDLIDEMESWLSSLQTPFYFLSSHAKVPYTDVSFTSSDTFIFGSETEGLPPHLWNKWPELFITLPMMHDSRCLNLANTVSIVLYESWRQQGFRGWHYAHT